MKRPVIAFLFLVLLSSSGWGQQDALSSQHMFNILTYNPGIAGTSGMICATALNRQQWLGFTGAPKTTIFNVSAPVSLFKIKSGLGLVIESDNIGFDKDINLSAAYSYLLDLNFGKLGLGINLGVIDKTIDPSWIIPNGDGFTPPDQDPLIKYSKGNTYISRHYYITAGYTLQLPNPSLELLPSLFAYSDGKVAQFNVTSLVRYNKKVWGGVSYRAGDALIGIVGFELYNGIRIGYSYDFTLSDIRKNSTGSHEFMVNYCFDMNLGKSPMRYKSIRFL
jgi:Type IX secretion system membrane protein PorP/SprF